MALKKLSEHTDYHVVDSAQDCRGWPVQDSAGRPLGTVAELMVDTARDDVDSLVLDTGARVRAADVTLRDRTVVLKAGVVPGAAAPAARAVGATGEVALPVVEERIVIGKRVVEQGGVRVHSTVQTTPVSETVQLREEQVTVQRRAVDRPVDPQNAAAFKEGVVEVRTKGEEAVVAKEARVVEEVTIGTQVKRHDETVHETVRKTDVVVEKLDGAALPAKKKKK